MKASGGGVSAQSAGEEYFSTSAKIRKHNSHAQVCQEVDKDCARLSHCLLKPHVCGSKQHVQAQGLLVVENSELVAGHQAAVEAETKARGMPRQFRNIAAHGGGHEIYDGPQFGVHPKVS